MLILTRKENQSVVFPNCGIVVHVLSVKGRTIKLGFEAPKDIEVLRGELIGDNSTPAPVNSASVAVDKAPIISVSEQIHDLKNRLNTVTLSIQLYNDLKSIGQDEAASSTLDKLMTRLADIDNKWSGEIVGRALDVPSHSSGEANQTTLES